MIAKMILATKELATNVTRKGPFVRVCTLVYLHVVRLVELSSAHFAHNFLLWPKTQKQTYIFFTFYSANDFFSFSNSSLQFKLFSMKEFRSISIYSLPNFSTSSFVGSDWMRNRRKQMMSHTVCRGSRPESRRVHRRRAVVERTGNSRRLRPLKQRYHSNR